MTVRELIEKLQKLSAGLQVVMPGADSDVFLPVDLVQVQVVAESGPAYYDADSFMVKGLPPLDVVVIDF